MNGILSAMTFRWIGISVVAILALNACSPTSSRSESSKPRAANTPEISTAKDGTMNVKTDDGSGSVGGGTNITEDELGVPFYPGSTQVPNVDFKFDTKNETTVSSVRESSDPAKKVLEFYRDKVKNVQQKAAKGIESITGQTTKDGTIIIAVRTKGDKTEITITTRNKR